MSEPLSRVKLERIKRRFEGVDEFMRSVDPSVTYGYLNLWKEAMSVAKYVPELLDEIERLKGEQA